MTRVYRSAVVGVLLVTACDFGSPRPVPLDPDAMTDTPDASPDAPPAQAWLDPWTRRKPITLLASQIEAPGDGELTNFPVLVSITDPQLAASARPDGADIVFTSNEGDSLLVSEIESYVPATGELVAWVKLPTLPATSDTRIYVYYGNPSPFNPPPAAAVWSPDHLAVWHLHQDPGGGGDDEIRDATGGGHDGTAENMEETDRIRAKIGFGFAFNGTDEYLDFGTMDFGPEFTISMWVNFAGGNLNKTLMANTGGGGDQNGFRYFINSANTADRRVVFETGNGQAGSVDIAQTNTNAVPLNTFIHVAVVVNRPAGTAFIYLDGARADTDMTIRNDFQTSSDFEIGRMENNVLFYGGTLDEIQVATTLRPAEWIRTAFNNQFQPGNFHAVGPEEMRP